MSGFLDNFRQKIAGSVWRTGPERKEPFEVDDKIALGVLLYAVAEADKKFLPAEKEEIARIIKQCANISDEDMSIVMAAVEEAARERIDLYRFTSEVSKDLSYRAKIGIIENLCRVACADKDLDNDEHEVIRNISGLLDVAHTDFIEAKIKIKKEAGMDTAG